jgi:hypothetical protein
MESNQFKKDNNEFSFGTKGKEGQGKDGDKKV